MKSTTNVSSNRQKQYNVLAKADVTDNRRIVISKFTAGEGYTLAQQIDTVEGRKILPIFLKGAFQIVSLEGLYNLRDALNEAIELEEVQTSKKKHK